MATTKKAAPKKAASEKSPKSVLVPFAAWEKLLERVAELEKSVSALLDRMANLELDNLECGGSKVFAATEPDRAAVEKVVRSLVEPQCLRTTKVHG